MTEYTVLATSHHERSIRRARLLQARHELARAERDLIALGPGDDLPGAGILLHAAGWCALAPATQVVEVRDDLELRRSPPGAGFAGDFVHRGRRLLAFDLAALVGVERELPRRPTVVVFTALQPFGLVVDAAALAQAPSVLVPGDPGSPDRSWRDTRVFVRSGDAVLPLLDVDALAREAAARSTTEDQARIRSEVRFLEEVEDVERLLVARGLSLCPSLRARLRIYCRAAATEGREPPYLPRIVGGDSAAVCELLASIATHDTAFFRDPRQLDALAHRLIHAADRGRALRIWSAGCATGEEAYSVAMLLAAARPFGADRVLATDTWEKGLAHARRARYDRGSLLEPTPLAARYLATSGRELEVAPEVRDRVTFQPADLRDPAPARDLDAILCRHALELLEPAVAARALRLLVGALRPGGYLLLGCTETHLAEGLPLERIDEGGAVLLRRPADARRARTLRLRDATGR